MGMTRREAKSRANGISCFDSTHLLRIQIQIQIHMQIQIQMQTKIQTKIQTQMQTQIQTHVSSQIKTRKYQPRPRTSRKIS